MFVKNNSTIRVESQNIFGSKLYVNSIRIIIAIGIFLRIYHYLDNRSLWLEEAFLAFNFLNRGFIGLLQPPLEYDQQAPVGFLLLEKILLLVLGKNEYALRFFPLICGITALILFERVARTFLSSMGALIALFCFAISNPAVYHSVDIKQYSTELLASVIILLSYSYYRRKTTAKDMFKWGLLGGALVWFSYSSVFVLAGVGTAVIWMSIKNKDYFRIRYLFVVFFIWILNFSINFFLFASKGTHLSWLTEYWANKNAFMPMPPITFNAFKWFAEHIKDLFDYPLAWSLQYITVPNYMRVSVIGLIFLLVGIIAWYKRKIEFAIAFSLPIVLTILASGLKLYPFYERLLLFLLPIFLLIIIKGLEKVYYYLKSYSAIGAYLLVIFSTGYLTFNTIYLTLFPQYIYNRIDTREAIVYLHQNVGKNEIILDNLNYDMGTEAWKYNEGVILNCYKTIYPTIDFTTTLINFNNNLDLIDRSGKILISNNNVKQFSYKRLWVIMKTVTNITIGYNENNEIRTNKSDYIVAMLKRAGGTITKEYISQGVKVILVEFR